MGVKPELAFDVCWEVYRNAREVLDSKRGISALNMKDMGKFLWRPDIRPRLNEWVADFALAGQKALESPECRFTYGAVSRVLPGHGAVRAGAPFSGAQRNGLGELDGRNTASLRQRVFAAADVPAAKIFPRCDLGGWSEDSRNHVRRREVLGVRRLDAALRLRPSATGVTDR